MKTACILLTIVLLFAAIGSYAQSPNRSPLKATVPFAFSVDDHWLPAGDYLIQTAATERAIRITSVDGKHAAVVNTVTSGVGSRWGNSRLLFTKYGDEYFLAEVWCKGDDFTRSPIASKRQKATAQSGGRGETDIVLAYAGH